METQRLGPPRRSARLVPMVLPLLHGSPHAGRRCPADQALEGDLPPRSANPEKLRTRRFAVPQAATPGAAALGLRQPENLDRDPRQQVRERIWTGDVRIVARVDLVGTTEFTLGAFEELAEAIVGRVAGAID